MSKRIEIKAGDRYSKLTIIEEAHPRISPNGSTSRKMLCRCDCGNIKEIILIDLRSGHTQSCGCQRQGNTNSIKHSLSHTGIYKVWDGMKQRCSNPNNKSYKDYGGRGIRICSDWVNDPKSFYDWCMANGYQKGLQIDRINNDGNYEPSNCRFVSVTINSQNRRSTVLDEDTAKRIRELREKTGWGPTKLARTLGISRNGLSGMLYNDTWNSNK